MSTRHDTQNIGHKLEVTEGTSAITSGATPYYTFGGMTKSAGDMPTYEKTFIPYYTSGIEPAEMVLVDKRVKESLAFTLTNGLPFYYLMGDSTTAASIHTLAYHKFPPTFTTRWETGYSGNYTLRDITACKIQSATLIMNFTQDYNEIGMGINIEGRTYGTSVWGTQLTPVHAVSGSSATDPPFYKDFDTTNQRIQWDWTTPDTGDNWVDKLLTCEVIIQRLHKWTKWSNSTTSNKIHSGSATVGVAFLVRRDDDTAFFNDFDADTLHDLRIKLYSSSSTYFELILGDVALSSVKPNMAIIEDNEVPTWQCAGSARAITLKFKDAVSDSLYND